jgi:hypothetical protein
MSKIDAIDSVWSLSKELVRTSSYVTIDHAKIEEVADQLRNDNLQKGTFAMPTCINGLKQHEELVHYELAASSINYCYWYGKSTIRPCDASSMKMYKLLDEAYDENQNRWSSRVVKDFSKKLMQHRFPLVEQRISHLNQLLVAEDPSPMFFVGEVLKGNSDLRHLVNRMVGGFPGFSQDMFLKRVFIFFMQLYRRRSFFSSEIEILPVPADYQIPKMLRHKGILKYNNELSALVDGEQLLASGSQMECEIRAATIMACKELGDKSGKSMADIDYWLWVNRKSCNDPFHLTITTDY